MLFALKAGGALCIVITCSAVGIALRQRLKDRADCLERLLAMLDYIASQIRYSRLPIGDIVRRMSEQRQFEVLPFLKLCRERMGKDEAFPVAWRESAVTEKKRLPQEDFERLLALGDCLGTTDAQEQEKTLLLNADLFAKSYEKARLECAERSRMYTTLGVLGGVGLAILIL